jgi:phosphopantothenate-cysteine ligase
MVKVLITSGGTKVPIDSVRDITNMSKGTFGANIAEKFISYGHNIIYFCASDSKSPYSMTIDFNNGSDHITSATKKHAWCKQHQYQYKEVRYRNYDDYARILPLLIEEHKPDIIVLAAAVSDYVTIPMNGKIRSTQNMNIELHKADKIISHVREWAPKAFIVGFKLLVSSTDDELISDAVKSLHDNGCNAIVANKLIELRSGNHRILYVTNNGTFEFKTDLVTNVVESIIEGSL